MSKALKEYITLKIPQQKDEISKEIKLLLDQYLGVNSLEELKLRINGNVETDGLIQKNNSTIAELENLKPKTDPGVDQVIEELDHLKTFNTERIGALSLIDEYKDEVSLKDLYSAILSNEGRFQDTCPACESQIYVDGKLALPLNPFTNATKKIEEFDKAIKLEERVDVLSKDIIRKLQFIQSKLAYMVTISESIEFPETETIDALYKLIDDFDDFEKQNDIISTLVHQKDIFSSLKEFLTEYNQRLSTTLTRIEELKQQNNELGQKLEEISSLQLKVKSVDNIEKESNEAIKQFRNENEDLITRVQKEKDAISLNCQYRDAYISLRNRLIEYNRQLPVSLAANLNSKTLEFYNLINRYDHPSDLLSEIILPDRPRKKIKIRFSVGEKQDALHVLSEGHLRCLGLAILLAKNVQDGLPLVIFDDVVNAIDDEHRRGIIDTIINSDFSNNKQLIITTHGEEFLKQLENSLPTRGYNRLVTRIDFLKTEESKKINVKLDMSRKYLIVAEQRFNDGQIRESLAPGRRALEFLVRTIWKRISRKYNIRLSVSMSSPDRPPELMATTQALVKYVKDNNIEEFEQLINLLEAVLEKPNRNQVIWNYLNKGTHDEERDEEFDRSIVKEIIELLIQIDDLVFPR